MMMIKKTDINSLIFSALILIGLTFSNSKVLSAEDFIPFEENSNNMQMTPKWGNDLPNTPPHAFSWSQPQTLRLDGVDDGDALGLEEVPISDGFLILAGLSIIYLGIKKRKLIQYFK